VKYKHNEALYRLSESGFEHIYQENKLYIRGAKVTSGAKQVADAEEFRSVEETGNIFRNMH
jgi:hypothetical protein